MIIHEAGQDYDTNDYFDHGASGVAFGPRELEPGSKIYGSFDFNGRTAVVTNMFDMDGEPVDDIGEAHTLVAYLSDREWIGMLSAGVTLTKVS